jgi:ABC-type antimicrobial peptide transport system permease subunit
VHEEPVPEIIAHISGDVPGTLSVVVRTGVAPLSMVDAMRAAVRELDPGIPLMNVRTMDTIRDAALARERLLFTVFGVLAACALVLACVGIYGVASQAARSRDREVGIRVALGATRGIIVRQFVGSGIPWIAAGLTLGVAGALSAGRVVESVLWGVTASDATTLFVVAFVLAGSGLLASFVPARRASIRDPAAVLRDEG